MNRMPEKKKRIFDFRRFKHGFPWQNDGVFWVQDKFLHEF